ncbi:vesicular-fusion protein SEC18 [Neoconidiobolus thromboides FSU 785]|nr:vesicular-fusion protein SEC18 [Neoconidiobolus thromboides FSU 785]
MTHRFIKSPREDLALTNLLLVNTKDFSSDVQYVLVNNEFIFTISHEPKIAPGDLGSTKIQREWSYLSLNQEVEVKPYYPQQLGNNIYLGSIDIEIQLYRKATEVNSELDVEKMAQIFIKNFKSHIFSNGQIFLFEFQGILFKLKVVAVHVVDLQSLGFENQESSGSKGNSGILLEQSNVKFLKASGSNLKLKGLKAKSTVNNLIQPDFKFEDMGIGGLDSEFSAIFRRAFASRIFPPSIVEKIGIQHVKGILLYGPPGTGKTLMARQIGKMLNAQEPKIVNGPEILNKYVGQSEENIRKLFADAESEYKEKGDESSLHIIIFDELDAICKQRGGKNDGTGVGDSVVNQLLSKLDGVEQLNNILVIGMTNRIDMIDEALLRPGRLEVHMEISLPDEKGRYQILKIHTSKMRNNDILGTDVDLAELSNLTKNFSGAEIQGLVKSASSFAFNRHTKVGTLAGVSSDIDQMKVVREDFLAALDEVHASFGVNETELKVCVQNGIIPYAKYIEGILTDGQLYVEQVKKSSRTPLVSVLLHGPAGSGKTALAASIAMASEFPFIKLISPESMVGYSESAKMAQISKIFNDSYKSPLSVIVVDNIERLLDWVPIGPRFSNSVLQTLLVLLKKRPPKDGNKLLIIATTNNRSVLEQMNLAEAFDTELYVPNLKELSEVETVVKHLELFSNQEHEDAFKQLKEMGNDKIDLGVKKLLMTVEMARQDVDKVDKFVSSLSGLPNRSY